MGYACLCLLELPGGQPLQAVHGRVGFIGQGAAHAVGQRGEKRKAVDDAGEQGTE